MNCPNCGAPMELFHRRRYFFCTHCGTFHFIPPDSGEDIQVVERRGEDLCPLCAAPLARSVIDGRHFVEHCERCRGVLMERAAFADVVTRRRAAAAGPATIPVPLDPKELRREVTCPRCRTRMDVHPYYGPGTVVIDTCRECDSVWLDSGELTQIVDAPGRDRRS
jgi:Zn-finger nucleic acid-binding protein